MTTMKLVTEKSGQLLFVDFKSKKLIKIKHNLKILEDGQGGLLEVLYYNGQVFVSYSENKKMVNQALRSLLQNLMKRF